MDKTNHIKAPIFAIDRLRLGTDGHGITTLVCFMGCPLNCAYCLNDRCHGEVFESDGVTPRCGIMMLTPQELYDRVKIDNIYFQATGGGICFGGGEPTLYAEFIAEFRKLCDDSWKITIETALHHYSFSTIEILAPVIDKWIIDVKDMDSFIYRQYTGQQSHVLQSLTCLERLKLIDKVTVKVPLIPDYNTEEKVNESIEKLKRRGFCHTEAIRYIKRLSKYPPQN